MKNKKIKIENKMIFLTNKQNPIPIKKLPRYNGLRMKAYGPAVVSSLIFRINPAAQKRISRPKIINPMPKLKSRPLR